MLHYRCYVCIYTHTNIYIWKIQIPHNFICFIALFRISRCIPGTGQCHFIVKLITFMLLYNDCNEILSVFVFWKENFFLFKMWFIFISFNIFFILFFIKTEKNNCLDTDVTCSALMWFSDIIKHSRDQKSIVIYYLVMLMWPCGTDEQIKQKKGSCLTKPPGDLHPRK